VRGNKSVHIGLQAKVSVHRLLVELYFDEVVWVRSDDEVYFSPVYHYYFLDVVHNIRELLPVNFIHAPIVLGRLEVSMKDLVLMQPLGLQYFVVGHLIGIVVRQER